MVFEDAEKYDEQFYDNRHLETSYSSSKIIIPLLKEKISFKSVVDVGCGIGGWLKAFAETGIEDYLGIDFNSISDSKLAIPKNKFLRHDLRTPLKLKRKFDLAISIEVAEHLEEKYADIFLNSLTNLSDIIMFSAAIPKQGGKDHVNEQENIYWVKKFKERRYICLDLIRPKILLNQKVGLVYRQNLLIFIKEDKLKKMYLNFLPLYSENFSLKHRTILIQSFPPAIRFAYRINNAVLGGLFNSFFDKLLLKSFFGDLAMIKRA